MFFYLVKGKDAKLLPIVFLLRIGSNIFFCCVVSVMKSDCHICWGSKLNIKKLYNMKIPKFTYPFFKNYIVHLIAQKLSSMGNVSVCYDYRLHYIIVMQ